MNQQTLQTLQWVLANPVPDNDQTLYPVLAVVREFGERKSSSAGKWSTKMRLADASGEQWVKVWDGNAGIMPGSHLGQNVNFNIKAQNFKGKTYLSGFWEIDSKTLATPYPAQQTTSYDTPQYRKEAAANAIRMAKSSSGGNAPDWDRIAEGKVRHGLVCAYLQGGLEPDLPKVLYYTRFVITGVVEVEGEPEEQPTAADGRPIDNDIPF